MKNVSDVIASTLKRLGVKNMFGLVGGETLDFIEAWQQQGLEYITTRHEGMAATMAEVTGQMTGVPGVCAATLGPGATNMVNGVANAFCDRQPVLAFAGQLSREYTPHASHQYVDLVSIFKPIVKKVIKLTPDKIGEQVNGGYRLALTPPMGPVLFILHRDVALSPCRDSESISTKEAAIVPADINEDALKEVSNVIGDAKRPLVILGVGLDPLRDSEKIRQFIRNNQFPVMTTPKVKGVFREDDPLFIGTASGMMADDFLVEQIMAADLVIGIGFDPVEVDKIWFKDINLLSINTYTIEYKEFIPPKEIVGNISCILDFLLEKDFSSCPRDEKWDKNMFQTVRDKIKKKLSFNFSPLKDTFSPYHIIHKIREAVPENTIVTTDTGAHKLLAGQTWPSYEPLTFFMSNGLSTMGYGVPSAIGAKLVSPKSSVICFTGDGGLTMVIQELETTVRLKLPIIFVVFADNTFGLIDVVQRLRGYRKIGVTFNPVDFTKIAEGFGAKGIHLDSIKDIPEILEKAFKKDKPTVLVVPTDSEEYHSQL